MPVRTDLRYYNSATPTLYDNNPAVPQHSVFASIYTLAPGSKVTVGSCVKIFDATFKVDQGASLIFTDHAQVCGAEDKSSLLGRYKIKGTGGAILRNYDIVQYVQNGVITQDLHATPYIAVENIIAGNAVDPDTDQPQGNYDIQAGGDVTFVASDYIHLTNGFQVSGGNFHAHTMNVDVPAMCYNQTLQGGSGGRNAYQLNATLPTSHQFKITPNPGTGIFNISNYNCNNTATINVVDVFGKTVYSTNISANHSQIDLTTLPKGIYLVKYSCDNTLQTQKVVLQ